MTSPTAALGIDDGLIARAQTGDREAMEVLLGQLRPYVVRRCARFLPFPEDADEAAQDALLAIATNLSGYTGSGPFIGWVSVIASNAARMTYRSLRRRAAERGSDALPEPRDPRTTSVVAGTRLDLMEAITQLEEARPLTVEAFVLRDLGAMSYDDIAATLGVTVAAARDRIHVARQFVRERLVERL